MRSDEYSCLADQVSMHCQSRSSLVSGASEYLFVDQHRTAPNRNLATVLDLSRVSVLPEGRFVICAESQETGANAGVVAE